jgi:hypothetical protein
MRPPQVFLMAKMRYSMEGCFENDCRTPGPIQNDLYTGPEPGSRFDRSQQLLL